MNKQEFNKYIHNISKTAVEKANKYLARFHNLSIKIDWSYQSWDEYGLEHAIGAYESGSVFEGEIAIAFNIRNLFQSFQKMVKRYSFTDEYTMLDEMIQTNVYHEMGHGLIELITDYLQETDELDELYDNNKDLFDSVLDNEEEAVEEFAWKLYDNDVESSDLGEMLSLYLNMGNDAISESRIRRIVRQAINEIASPILYHYINIDNLYLLLRDNAFRTCNPEKYMLSKKYNISKRPTDSMRFLSFTRNGNPAEGYPIIKLGEYGDGDCSCICRLTIDGNAFNTYNNFKDDEGNRQKFEVHPFDWGYKSGYAQRRGYTNGKTENMQSTSFYKSPYFVHDNLNTNVDDDFNEKYSAMYHHPFSQSEDRLSTNAELIPNATKYIKKIDVYLRDSEYFKQDFEQKQDDIEQERRFMKASKRLAYELGIPFEIHRSMKKFKYRKDL